MWFMKMKEPIPIISSNRNEKQPLGKTCQMAFFMVLFPAVRRSFRFSRSARPLLLVRNALSAAGDLCLSSLLSSCLSSLMRGSLIGVLSFVGILIGILQKFCPSCGCPLFVCCHIVFRIYLPSGQLCMMLRRKAQRTASSLTGYLVCPSTASLRGYLVSASMFSLSNLSSIHDTPFLIPSYHYTVFFPGAQPFLFRHSAKASIKNALREVLRTFPFLFSFFQAGIVQLQPHAEAFFHILPRQMIKEAV